MNSVKPMQLVGEKESDAFTIYHAQVVTEMKRLQADVTSKLKEEQIYKMVAQKWNQMSETERKPFEIMAQQKREALAQMPQFNQKQQHFQPSSMPSASPKSGIPALKSAQAYPNAGHLPALTKKSGMTRKRTSEVRPGEAISDDILPISYPLGVNGNATMDQVQKNMSGRILFSRHLRNVLKEGYRDQMSDERINKILASCWDRLPQQSKIIYELYSKQKEYIEDTKGIRENRGKSKQARYPQAAHGIPLAGLQQYQAQVQPQYHSSIVDPSQQYPQEPSQSLIQFNFQEQARQLQQKRQAKAARHKMYQGFDPTPASVNNPEDINGPIQIEGILSFIFLIKALPEQIFNLQIFHQIQNHPCKSDTKFGACVSNTQSLPDSTAPSTDHSTQSQADVRFAIVPIAADKPHSTYPIVGYLLDEDILKYGLAEKFQQILQETNPDRNNN